MSNTVIQLKYSATPGNIPSGLANGEIALNFADGKFYYKNVTGQIVSFAGSGNVYSFSTINANNSLITALSNTSTLTIKPGLGIGITSDIINDIITIDSFASYNLAQAAFGYANGLAVGSAAQAFGQANAAYTVANAAFGYANSIGTYESASYGVANAAFTVANSAYGFANGVNTFAYGVAVNAAAAFAAANNVAPQVTPAFNTANAAYALANAVFNQDNVVFGVANAAFGKANTALQNTTGTFNGTLSVNGDILSVNAGPSKIGWNYSGQYFNWLESGGAVGNNYIRFATGNAERMRLANGNLGIGTVSPNRVLEVLDATNPQLRLSVNTSSYGEIYSSPSDGFLHLNSTGTGSQVIIDTNYLNVTAGTILLGSLGFGVSGDAVFRSVGGNSSVISPVFKIKDSVGALAEGIRFAPTWANSVSGYYQATMNISSLGVVFATVNTNAAASSSNTTWYGNFGIGTTSPTANLHVIGTANVTSTIYTRDIIAPYYTLYNEGAGAYLGIPGNYLRIGGLSEFIRIANTSGYVGIGTTSPTEKLQIVNGNIFLPYATANTGALIGSASSDNFTTDGVILPHYSLKWAIGAAAGGSPSAFLSGYGGIRLFTGGTEQVRIISGNVGIGTTSPSYKLDVAGTANISSILYTGSDVYIPFNNYVRFGNSTTNAGALTNDGANTYLRSIASGNISMRLGSTDYVWISSSGYVGIGTTSPSYKLDVSGIANVANLYINGSDAIASANNWANTKLSNTNVVLAGNIGVVGYVSTTRSVYDDSTSQVVRITNPGGGAFSNGVATATGAFKIRIPAAANNNNTMLRITAKIYNYVTGTATTIQVGGYNYSGGGGSPYWVNTFATQETQLGGELNIRFGRDATTQCIWVGELATNWSYPKVYITEVEVGHNGATAAAWREDWQISQVAAFDTVDSTVVVGRSLDTQNFAANVYPYVNTSVSSANNYAGAMANSANAYSANAYYTVANGTASFGKANSALQNTTGVVFSGNLTISQNLSAANISVTGAATYVSANSVTIGSSEINSISLITSTATNQIIDTFSNTLFRSAHYVVSMNSANDYQTTQILVVHNDATVYISEYGMLYTGNNLGIFSGNYVSGSPGTIQLNVTPTFAVTTIRLLRTATIT